jgi:hypothetical protein
MAHLAQGFDGLSDDILRPVASSHRRGEIREQLLFLALDQRALGKKHIRHHIETHQIVADLRQHHVDRAPPDDGKPLGFRHFLQLRAIIGGEFGPAFLEIIAGVKALRDLADILAQGLAISQKGGAREHVDLRAGVIDVVFARHGIACKGEQTCERIAEHRAAAMADMQGAGWIGGDIFDIDRLARAHAAAAVVIAVLQHLAQRLGPDTGFKGEVDEAGAGDFDLLDPQIGTQCVGNRLGQITRIFTGILGQHHGGIGRHVAMGRIARRLDQDPRQVGTGAERGRAGRVHTGEHGGKQMLWWLRLGPGHGAAFGFGLGLVLGLGFGLGAGLGL